jgi:transglutaminase/protease-like cytokinesis protein 3
MVIIILFGCASSPKKQTPAVQVSPMQTTTIIDKATGKIAYTFIRDQPDNLVVNLPEEIRRLQTVESEEFIRQLSGYIVQNSSNDFEIVKKIHDWIAINIRYDVENFRIGNINNQDYYDVLRTGLTVCTGFSNLFKRLCDETGIECITVYGHGRESAIFEYENPRDGNHVWNMVKIDNEWYMLDCTWDAGSASEINGAREYSTDYLFVKPEVMIYSHFPENPEYQLLDPPKTENEFVDLPFYHPKFFNAVIETNPALNKINTVQGILNVDFFMAHENIYLIIQILDMRGKEIKRENIYKTGNRYRYAIIFPGPGKYIVRCFSREQQQGFYERIADYGIISTQEYGEK